MVPFVPGAGVSDLSQGVFFNWQGRARKKLPRLGWKTKGLKEQMEPRSPRLRVPVESKTSPDREPIPFPSGEPEAPRTCHFRAPLPFSLCQIWKPRREIRNLTSICPMRRLTRSNPTRLHLAFRSFTPRAFALSHISRVSVFPSCFFSDADQAPSSLLRLPLQKPPSSSSGLPHLLRPRDSALPSPTDVLFPRHCASPPNSRVLRQTPRLGESPWPPLLPRSAPLLLQYVILLLSSPPSMLSSSLSLRFFRITRTLFGQSEWISRGTQGKEPMRAMASQRLQVLSGHAPELGTCSFGLHEVLWACAEAK